MELHRPGEMEAAQLEQPFTQEEVEAALGKLTKWLSSDILVY